MKMFEIIADYRSSNEQKPCYYVMAENKKSARRTFQSIITWLKIYEIKEVIDKERVDDIRSHPLRYIVL